MFRNLVSITFAFAFVFFLFTERAHAYIDPGTGSMILQALIAGAVAALAFGKQIYRYVYNFLHAKEEDEEDKGKKPKAGEDA